MPSCVKRTQESFIKLSNIKHNNAYTYDKVNYIDNLTNVFITCSIHGDFEQLPKCHLRGNGCKKCSRANSANKQIINSKENFFTNIKTIDNENRWDYSKVEQEFSGTNNNIPLTCNGCGNTTYRTPYNHLHKFQPCKRSCFIIKNKVFDLKDNVIITNEIVQQVNIIEEWKIFPDNKNYLISNKGYIKNIKTQEIFNGSLDKISGYMRTQINKKTYSIHYMVARTFLPNIDNKKTVNHKNKIRTDNSVENLEWATHAEQNTHKNKSSIKTYKQHNNGTIILRIDKDTDIIIEKYDSIMLAAKYIMEHIYKIDTNQKNIDTELKSISSSLSQKIKSNNNNYFGYNFIWRKSEEIKIQQNEIWEPITNIEKKGYYISNLGNIKNPSGKVKNKFSISGGYHDLKIIKNGQHHKIHRLVALHFIKNPNNKPYVNHKNGNKLDNRVENLEWVTNQENVIHGYENGLNTEGLTEVIQYDKEGKNIIKKFKSISDASKSLNISSSSISACCRGKTLQTKGFHFKYKTDINKIIRNKLPNFTCGKKIYQYDKNNNLIKTFNTIKECAYAFNVNRSTITNKINEKITKNEELNKYIIKLD